MDDRQFDTLTRSLGGSTTRRQAIRGLLGLVAGAVGLKAASADAARRGHIGLQIPSANWDVVLHGTPSGTSGRCRITCISSNGPSSVPATFNVASTDGSFAERVLGLLDSTGGGSARTQGSVPINTKATCVVRAGGWATGSDTTTITC